MLRQAPLALALTSLVLVLILFYLRGLPSEDDPVQPMTERFQIPPDLVVRSKTITLEIPDSLSFAGEARLMELRSLRLLRYHRGEGARLGSLSGVPCHKEKEERHCNVAGHPPPPRRRHVPSSP